MKNFLSLVGVYAAIIVLGIVGLVFSPRSDGPRDWDETNIEFATDEEMRAYDDFLIFNTDGLTGAKAYRCLSFDTPQDKETGRWSHLHATYSMADASNVVINVYPNESNQATVFFDVGSGEMELGGVSIRYKQIEGKGYDFRTLFQHGSRTYEVCIYSPNNPDVLVDYLQRILLPN